MKELRGVLIYRLLQFELRWTLTRHITYPSCRRVKLGETVHQPLSGPRGVGDLLRGGRIRWALECLEQLLKFREKKANTTLKLQQIVVGAGKGNCLWIGERSFKVAL